jgi:myosin heavy subunit
MMQGKYMQIMFSKQLKIVGGSTIKYLLEKSRVIKLGPGERNYHVFYMLFQQDATKKKAMGLEAGPKEFYYTNQSGVYEADGWKDDKEWEDSMVSETHCDLSIYRMCSLSSVQAAWKMLGVEQEEIDNIYQMVAGVLWLGNHTFSGEDDSEIDDDDVTDKAAALFEADAEMMSTTLTYRNMQSGGRSIVVIPLKPAQAEESRDGLAKAAYDRLFSWVVDRVNEASKAESDTMSFIGVLDIFGFEIFELNSFEQLCINLANEKLQSHFNGHIFKLEQQIYLEEELKIDKIEFVDNQECLDLIEKKPKGILPMLDEECVVPKGSDMSLIQKLTETHRKSPFFEKPRKKGQESTFVVNHYAGGVAYGIDNFLDKNRDVLQPDVQSFMAGSKNSLVKTLFPPPAPKRGRAPTLGGQFKKSLQELYDKLMSTEPHFIKCVKPNTIKQPAVFDSKFTLRQLQYLGLLEVIRIRRLGYPVRRDPADFYQRYTCLDDGAAKNAQELAQKIGTADQWQMGKTKLFMKDEMYFGLETKRGMFMEERVKRLQSFLRSSLQGRVWQKNRQSIVIMQGFCRGVMARAIYARKIDERDADAALQEAIGERSKALLETAISKASDLDYAAPQLKEARELLERVKQEQRVQNLLDEAIEEESEDKLAVAIQEAADIDYMDSSVQKAKDIVADIKKKRMEEEEKKGKAEIARLKKEREDEARAALSSAISSTYSPRERRGQLQLAIAKADELIPDDPNIAKAKEELETLKASMGAKDMLDSAIESGDPDAIADAIEQSEGKPGVTAEEIDSAKKKLEEARSNKEVIKQLKDAMAGKSTEAVKAAVAAAGERGYDGEELQHAKLYLQQLESAKSNTKSAVLARSEGMEYEAMLDDQSKVMLIKNYEKLRQRDGASFTFSQLPIKTSLLTIPPGPSAQALTALSVSLFNSILGYTGASLMQYPALLAMEVLQKGLEQEDLRDEIYVQAVKQTFGSEGEVSARAWQMIYLCSKTFPPSEELFPFVRAHVYLCKTGRLEGVTAQDQVFADMLLQKLEKVYQDGAAESPPTQEAIQALRDREDITATIYFLDNSMKRYPITEETTIKQLLATIAKDLNYQQMDTCAIFDVKDFEHPQFLKQNLVIYKITQGWQAALKKGFKGKMRVKKTSSHKLVFRKRLYLSEPAEKITCPVDLHLLFSQARQDVAFGRFAITEVEALLLASLTLQIEYGDYDPKKHQGGFLRDILQEYIPANVYSAYHISLSMLNVFVGADRCFVC